jgi:hypothetical protein
MLQAVLAATRNSFNKMKKRLGSRSSGGFLFVERPFFDVDVELRIPSVNMNPSLEEIQQSINETAKKVRLNHSSNQQTKKKRTRCTPPHLLGPKGGERSAEGRLRPSASVRYSFSHCAGVALFSEIVHNYATGVPHRE